MSASRHLNNREFGGYKPYQEETREAQDWLSTSAGHRWQTINFRSSAISQAVNEGSRENYHMFSVKKDVEHRERIWEYADPAYQPRGKTFPSRKPAVYIPPKVL